MVVVMMMMNRVPPNIHTLVTAFTRCSTDGDGDDDE